MALALLKIGLERERSQQRSTVQTRETVIRGENNMLRLHESLSSSLYKNKDRSNEKLSVKIVLFVTLFATLATGTFTHMYNPLIIFFYFLFVWILPMWCYTIGIKKKNSFLLFPWILVFGVHAVVLELFLLGAACETFVVYVLGGAGVSGEDSEPIIVISGTFIDFFILLLLSIPLPLLLSVPVKAFVYMDINRRRLQRPDNQDYCCNVINCCKKTKDADATSDGSEDVSEHIDNDEENPADNTTQTSSLIITRFQRLNQQHNIVTTVIRERLAGTETTNTQIDGTNNENDNIVENDGATNACISIPTRFPSLYDLASITEDLAETEEATISPAPVENTLDSLPPSYSQAEGLDQLPSYSEVEVSRMRLGPYVMVYDKGQKNMLTFKK